MSNDFFKNRKPNLIGFFLNAGIPIADSPINNKVKSVGDMSFASQRRHGYATPEGDYTDRGEMRFTKRDWDGFPAAGITKVVSIPKEVNSKDSYPLIPSKNGSTDIAMKTAAGAVFGAGVGGAIGYFVFDDVDDPWREWKIGACAVVGALLGGTLSYGASK